MSLYKVVTKRRKCCNGVNIEAGMEAQVVTPVNMTVQVNNWQYVLNLVPGLFFRQLGSVLLSAGHFFIKL